MHIGMTALLLNMAPAQPPEDMVIDGQTTTVLDQTDLPREIASARLLWQERT